MITTPKTLPTRASVDDVRAQMADDHVHMVLLTDGDTLRGTVVRTDLPPAGSGHEAALRWAVLRDRTVSPDTPTALVQARLNHAKMRRLAVVDADDTLLGLVCLKRSRSGFCSDADVAARKDAAATPRGWRVHMHGTSLTALAEEHLATARDHSAGRSALTVYGGKGHALRQTLIALVAGRRLGEHESPGEATVQVLRGSVRLHAGENTWDGSAGDHLVIPPTRHDLEALEDAAVLLTVSLHGVPAT